MAISDLLSLAIQKEIEACALYAGAASRTNDPAAKTLLEELASEETKHRELLEGLDPTCAESFKPPEGNDLRISDYLEPKPLSPKSSLQDVLVHAMKREEEARTFYQTMADAVQSAELAALLEKLAGMENAHKGRLEAFYEEVFLREM